MCIDGIMLLLLLQLSATRQPICVRDFLMFLLFDVNIPIFYLDHHNAFRVFCSFLRNVFILSACR